MRNSILTAAAVLASLLAMAPSLAAPTTAANALKPINRAALQTMLDTTAKQHMIPGAVILLRTPQGEFAVSYGTGQRGKMQKPTSATYFRIASNTKTMTAAVIVQLAQEGKLRFGDPVSKYVAGVPNGNHITVAELLNMRSGLYNFLESPQISKSADTDPTRVWRPAQMLSIAFAKPPNFAPNAEYEYNNTNYVLLGLIAEKIEHKTLAQSMHDRLFAPLGMTHTLLPLPSVNTIPAPYSHGYLYGSTSVAFVGKPPYSQAFKAAARAGTTAPNDYTDLNHSFAWAAGGANSNADDVATWIQALVSGRVFNPRYQQIWLRSLRPEDPKQPAGQAYGYGISRVRFGPNTIYFHGGETAGYNSFIGYDPINKVTLIVWTNLTLDLDQQPTANLLMLKVLEQIYTVSPFTPASRTH
ncbi:MAG TPA: serine hydrolase domain-containing protein [Candidatus Tumulicola sp.]